MQNDFWRRWGLPLGLLAGHTLLIETAAVVETNGAWNDQNATMLLALAIPVVDAPVQWMIEPVASWQSQPGTHLFLLKLLGGIFWFGVGWTATRLVFAFHAPPAMTA